MNPGGRSGRVPPPTKKLVVRKATSQRDLRVISERITLERILGLSVPENSALACDPVTGLIAYPAGCVIVLFNPRKNKQSFIINNSKKTITSVAFSKDGKYLATGESGHMPSVRVWDVEDSSHPQVSEMEKGHKFGVLCVAFSPNMKHVVSVGYHHDMLVNIWNWKTGNKLASNKVSSKVCSFSFSPCGSYFMTSGVRHVKFWYLDADSKKSGKTTPLFGRSALLNDKRNNTFCGVACGLGENADTIYSVTKSGLLCSFDSKKRVLEQYVELRASKARCIAVSEQYIFCGCTDGIIRVFNPSTLKFIATLPKPHSLGVNVSEGINPSHLLNKKENAIHADTVAMVLDNTNNRLTCVYSDRSLYIWDVTDIKKIGKIHSALYHSDCVWGVEVYPPVVDNRQAALPPGSFVTCSSDDTVRVWNVHEGTDISFQRNVYSKELMRILYPVVTQNGLKDGDAPPSKNARESSNDSKGGVRSIRISHDGQLLALGDRSGNVRVYDVVFFDELITIAAHESEVLCIEFSPPSSGHKLIATAGRDRLVHVFDMSREYCLMQTIDDHSASITSVKFNMTENDDFQLLSCGADKSMIFRSAQKSPDLQFVRTTNYVGKTTLYDMDIESASGKYAATAGQDRNVRVYDVVTGKQTRCYKGAQGDDGTLIRICLDSSGLYVATSCSDKSLYMYEFDTGECVASMLGHSEIVTGLKFTADCKNLISVSGDGCIFIWKIPKLYTDNMVDKLVELGREPAKQPQPETPFRRGTFKVAHVAVFGEGNTNGFRPADPSMFDKGKNEASPPVQDYRFSVGQLPSWAKKQLIAKEGMKSLTPEQQNEPTQPGGRWAQRLNNEGINGQDQFSLSNFAIQEEAQSPYTLSPISLEEQMQVLRNSPLERKCSLTRGEDDDLFPQNGRAQVEALMPNDHQGDDGMPVTVTLSRGSDVGTRLTRGNSIISLEAGEIKFEQAQELAEDEVKESIIYLPATQDDFDSEVASNPLVKSMARHYECLHDSYKHSSKNNHLIGNLRSPDVNSTWKKHELDFLPTKLKGILRSFRVTSAQKPQRLSLNLEDIEGTEADVKENLDIGTHKKSGEGSSEDDDDEVLTPTDDVIKSVSDDQHKPEGGESGGDGEDECSRYFESLGFSPAQETLEPVNVEKLAPLDVQHLLGHRLSISARFLSRSQSSTARTGNGLDSHQNNADEKKDGLTAAEEHKQDLQKRKDEMARAVDETRKRLAALGWKSTKDAPTSNSSSTSTVTMTTSHTVTSSAAVSPPELDLTPVSIQTSARSMSPVVRNLAETLLPAAEPQTTNDKQVVPEKDHSPQNVATNETGDKSKRSASDLIAFFSHPKFSSLKTKNKEKDKEKDKEKGKGKAAGAADKDRSSSATKLNRRSSAGELNPKSKSWRRSLGIGSSSSKPEKEARRTSVPVSSKPTSSAAVSTKTGLSRIEEVKSDKRVPLREKKGRMTADERKAKARSTGDINKQLKKVEVSILDPSTPPTRTVSTMDIPNKVNEDENSALLGKRSVLPTTVEANTTVELKSVSMSIKLSPKSGESSSPKKHHSLNATPAAAGENVRSPSAEGAHTDSPSASERAESLAGTPDSPIWRRRLPIDAASSPARSSSSSSSAAGVVASPSASVLPDAESSPSPAMRSPPQPTRLKSPDLNPRPSGACATGEDKDSIAQAAQEAVQNLVRAFRSVTDIQEKALEQEPNAERHRVLSMLSDAFGAMGEECFQRKPATLPRQTSGVGARRMGSPFSFSTGNLESLIPKTTMPRRISESSASIPDTIEEEKLSGHLEKYSDMLVELVKAKLLK